MSKGTQSRRRTQIMIAAIAMVALLFAAVSLAAGQDPQRKFKPGEMVDFGGGQSVEIISCEGQGSQEDCLVRFYRDGTPGAKMHFSGQNIRGGEARNEAAKELAAAKERAKARQQAPNANDNADQGPKDPQRKFKPGEMVDFGGGQSVEIISCEGQGSQEDCMVRFYTDGTPGNRMRFSGRNIREGEARNEAAKELAAAKERAKARQDGNAGDNKTPTPTPRDSRNPTPAEPKGQTQTAGCNYEPPAPQHSNSAAFSESLAKRELFDTYGWAANGTGQAPLRVGVDFLTFRALKPYKNIVQVIPFRGAERLNDAAPPNAMMYPVKSTHIVCEEYRDRVKRRQVDGEYDCFKNKDGEWVCGSSGKMPKITQLN